LAGPVVFLLRLVFFVRFALAGTVTGRPVFAAVLAAISNPKQFGKVFPAKDFLLPVPSWPAET
jgi:hypothetical protein